MQYRSFSGQLDELRSRISEAEKRHYGLTVDRKVLESLKDDNRLLACDDELHVIEKTLEILYSQLPE